MNISEAITGVIAKLAFVLDPFWLALLMALLAVVGLLWINIWSWDNGFVSDIKEEIRVKKLSVLVVILAFGYFVVIITHHNAQIAWDSLVWTVNQFFSPDVVVKARWLARLFSVLFLTMIAVAITSFKNDKERLGSVSVLVAICFLFAFIVLCLIFGPTIAL